MNCYTFRESKQKPRESLRCIRGCFRNITEILRNGVIVVSGGGQGGGNPRRTGGGRGTGDGRRKGGGRDLYDGGKRERNSKRQAFAICYCLLPVKETNPRTFLDFHLTFSEAYSKILYTRKVRLSKKSFVGFHMAWTSRDFVARGRPLLGQ